MARHYLALTKPRITVMVAMTSGVGAYLASETPEWLFIGHVLAGTALASGGASALNMAMEHRVDEKMPRTAGRPIPAGKVPVSLASIFGILLGLAGVGYLWVTTNMAAALVALVTILSYVLIYTPMKKVTVHSTLVGAIPGGLPPVIGWAAAAPLMRIEPLILFAIMFFWQLPHFWAIAWLYREDYRQGGLRMLAVEDCDGKRTRRNVILHSLLMVAASLAPWHLGWTGNDFGLLAGTFGLVFMASSVAFVASMNKVTARLVLVASLLYLPGLLVALAMMAKAGEGIPA